MTLPLSGLVVLELAEGITGPYLGFELAAAGADVYKLEPPDGDRSRGWAPVLAKGFSAPFVALNRNKFGACVDFESPDFRQLAERLLARADVLIIDADHVFANTLATDEWALAVNPKLVYASVSGYGPEGPLSELPPGELPVQMMSEATSSLGSIGEPPLRLGTPVASMYAAIYGAQAVAAALVCRDLTGEGQLVDTSMLGSLLAMRSTLWVARSNPDEWWGFHLDSYVKEPFRGYACRGGRIYFNLQAGEFDIDGLLRDLDMEWVREDPSFVLMREDRGGATGRYSDLVRPLWERAFAELSRDEVIEIIERHGGVAFPANDYEELLAGEQAAAVGVVREIEQPGVGRLPVIAPAWTFDGEEPPERRPAPLLGEHTERLLKEVGGYSQADVLGLLRAGVAAGVA